MARVTLFALLLHAAAVSAQDNLIFEPSSTTPVSVFWTATTRLIDVYSLDLYTYRGGSVTTDSLLRTRTIRSDVTPTASPTYSSTSTGSYESDVEQVFLYYPTGAAAESDLVPDTRTALTRTAAYTSTEYDYSMAVIMTAPSTCSSKFTITSVASVYVPSAARALVKPTSIETGRPESDRYGRVTMSETWHLSDGSAPYHTSLDHNYRYYIQSCRTPPIPYRTRTASATATSRGGTNDKESSSSGSRGDAKVPNCYWNSYGCIFPVMTIVIIVASIVGGLFLLGFLESWLWFRRLMLGRSAMRFGTICWILISLWVLCATRMQDRRTPEDRELLAAKWKEMKAGAKLKAWLKYGFRHRYPEEYLGQYSRMTVGIVPPGEPLHPQMPTGMLPGGKATYSTPPSAPAPYSQGVPPGQHAGFHGHEMTKAGVVARASYAHPQPHQSMIPASQDIEDVPPPLPPRRNGPTPPPKDVLSEKPTQDAAVQDVPTQDAPTQDTPTQDAPTQDAPPLPAVEVSEMPATEAPKAPSNTSNAGAPRHDSDNKSLYE